MFQSLRDRGLACRPGRSAVRAVRRHCWRRLPVRRRGACVRAKPRLRDRRLPNPGDGGVAARPRARRALRTDEGVRAAAGGARAGQRILPVQAARLCQLRVFPKLLPERLALLPTVTSSIRQASRGTIWPRIQVNVQPSNPQVSARPGRSGNRQHCRRHQSQKSVMGRRGGRRAHSRRNPWARAGPSPQPPCPPARTPPAA